MLNTFLGSNVSSEKCANTLSIIFQSTRTTWSDQWDLYLFYFPAYCPLAWSRSTRRMENQWETQMVSASDVSQVTTQTTAISGIRLFLGKQFFIVCELFQVNQENLLERLCGITRPAISTVMPTKPPRPKRSWTTSGGKGTHASAGKQTLTFDSVFMNVSSHLLFGVLQRWHARDGQVWVPLLQRPCWWHLQMEGRERFHSRSRSHNLKHDTPQRCRRLRCTGSCHNNLFIFAENMFMFKMLHRSLAPKVGLAWPQFMIPTVTLIWLNWPRASKSNFRPLPGTFVKLTFSGFPR